MGIPRTGREGRVHSGRCQYCERRIGASSRTAEVPGLPPPARTIARRAACLEAALSVQQTRITRRKRNEAAGLGAGGFVGATSPARGRAFGLDGSTDGAEDLR